MMPEFQEHPSTYIVQDRLNPEELTRLQTQETLLTQMLGGALPEQQDPSAFRHVLDVGCGAGGWLVQAAQTYPSIQDLIGVDISATMAHAAREHAKTHQVSDRIQIYVMDVLRMLEFRDNAFDLVNQRLASSFLRTWDWSKTIGKYVNVCRPGGVIRLTECDLVESNSPAHTELTRLFRQVFYQAGYFWTLGDNGATRPLTSLLTRHGLKDVQHHITPLHFRGGTDEGNLFTENITLGLRTTHPFLQKWIRLPKDYDELCQQAIDEMQHEHFEATWRFWTVWGKVS